jgi:hypothetical protein
MNATQVRSKPQPLTQFVPIVVESETGNDARAYDSRLVKLERPHRLARIRRRASRHTALATRSAASISWATATAPPRMCL